MSSDDASAAMAATDARDAHFMGLALLQAEHAAALGEVPVGAVAVVADTVVGVGFNRREALQDPLAHAELRALSQAARAVGYWRLDGVTLYVTLEPCPMCAGALVNARVARLVYGATDPKAGAVDTLYRLVNDSRLNHRVAVTAGVRADECGAVLSAFFQKLRGQRKTGSTRRDDREAEGA